MKITLIVTLITFVLYTYACPPKLGLLKCKKPYSSKAEASLEAQLETSASVRSVGSGSGLGSGLGLLSLSTSSNLSCQGSSSAKVEYFDTQVCYSRGITIREFIPKSVLSELEEKYMENKCKFLSTFAVYPPNIAHKLVEYTEEKLTYDYVAVGSDAGVLSAIKILAESGKKVLIVEKGRYPPQKSTSLYYRTSLLLSDYVIPIEASAPGCDISKTIFTSNVLGGVTNYNNNAWNVGSKSSYNKWSQISEKWNWETVSKYYKQIESYQQVERKSVNKEIDTKTEVKINLRTEFTETSVATEVKKAFSEIGLCDKSVQIDSCDRKPGFSIIPVISENDNDVLFAHKMMEYVKGQKNVELALKTEAVNIMFDQGKATGVQIRTESGDTKIIKINEELILGTGSINSVKLLAQSGVGDRNVLQKLNIPLQVEVPHLGKDFIINPLFIGLIIKFPAGILIQDHISDLTALEYLYGQTKMAPGMALNFYKQFLQIESEEVNVQVNFYAFSKSMNDRLRSYLKGFFHLDEQTQEYICKLVEKYDLLFLAPQLLDVRSRGSISVISDISASLQVKIDTGMYKDDSDLNIMIKTIQKIEMLSETSCFRKLGGELVHIPSKTCKQEDKQCLVRYFSIPNLTPTGGLIMGRDAQTSVVNEELLVHNTKNVRVFSAGVIPVGLSSDSSACVSMIGTYGAELISKRKCHPS